MIKDDFYKRIRLAVRAIHPILKPNSLTTGRDTIPRPVIFLLKKEETGCIMGDNIVGFLSQMGWTEVLLASEPSKRISFEKIFINIDTDGGNFGFDHYHGKIQHRTIVMQKIKDYLFE